MNTTELRQRLEHWGETPAIPEATPPDKPDKPDNYPQMSEKSGKSGTLPAKNKAITPEQAEDNFRARWGMSSAEWWERHGCRLNNVQPAAQLVTCGTCAHAIPNPCSPANGYAKCSAGRGWHWPRARQVCPRHAPPAGTFPA